MKKLLLMMVLLLPILNSCKKDSKTATDTSYREKAWNSLAATEKATVTHDWQVAVVDKNATYNNKNVVSVRFNTNMDALLGPILVFVDPATIEVVGQGMRL